MKKLIKMATAAASIGAMLSFAGCGAKAPDAVTLDVLKTLQAGKATPEYLAKNCTERTAGLFTMFGAMAAEAMKGATFTVVDTKVNGNKAVVTIKQDGGEKPGAEKYDLVKVDGKWKLDVNKEESSNESSSDSKTNDDSNAKKIADACVSNMKQIQTAFEQALMAGKTVKSISDLCGADGYFKVEPKCPLGGRYQIDKDFNITCSSGEEGHSLSAKAEDKDGRANAKGIADACVRNMKLIQAAWEQAMMAGETVKRISDLCGANRYITSEPECPLGEKYQIDKDGNVTCPSGATGHVLPQ